MILLLGRLQTLIKSRASQFSQDHISLKWLLWYKLRIIQIAWRWHFMSKLNDSLLKISRLSDLQNTFLAIWVAFPYTKLHIPREWIWDKWRQISGKVAISTKCENQMCLMPKERSNAFCWVSVCTYFVESVSYMNSFSFSESCCTRSTAWVVFYQIVEWKWSKLLCNKLTTCPSMEWWIFKTQFQVKCCQLTISNVTRSVHEMAGL